MATRKVSLDDLERLSINPETGALFWDNQEVLTTLDLPPTVNGAIIAAAVIAGVGLLWSIIRYFLERSERRRAERGGTGRASDGA